MHTFTLASPQKKKIAVNFSWLPSLTSNLVIIWLQDASPGLKASDRIEYGDIREERWQQFYEKNSPINDAANITVPLLVQHGVNDPQDPVTESDRLVTAIREAGGTVEYLRMPDEGHNLKKQKNRIAYYRRVADFLERHLNPAAADMEARADADR